MRQPSVICGHLRTFSENDEKCSYELRRVFREFSKIFENVWKMFGNLWEIAKISSILLFIFNSKQNITCLLVDMCFIFSCSTQYLTRSLCSLVRYQVEHSKIKFVSTRGHVNILYETNILWYYMNMTNFESLDEILKYDHSLTNESY